MRRALLLLTGLAALLFFFIIPLFLTFSPGISEPLVNSRIFSRRTGGLFSVSSKADNEENLRPLAWAIPVGGKTVRGEQLGKLVQSMIKLGVQPQDVHIFEDDGSRPVGADRSALLDLERLHGVSLHQSHVDRSQPEPAELFGLYLARHYHFMMDYLLYSPGLYEAAVLIEDDLILGSDAVEYFTQLTKLMKEDSSIWCVCGHADNAFRATSPPFQSSVDSPAPENLFYSGRVSHDELFPFRRGSHFMAPGWATSRRIYQQFLRPNWMDEKLNLLVNEQLRMPNGNWDAFLDAMFYLANHQGDKKFYSNFAIAGLPEQAECIFPAIPRISHVGANGYTVSAAMQAELFDNLRRSHTPANQSAGLWEYSKLRYLLSDNYDTSLYQFSLEKCIFLSNLREISYYRSHSLCLFLPAHNEKDSLLSIILHNEFHLIGMGGHANFQVARGIHKGNLWVYMGTNLLFLISAYSPVAEKLTARLQAENPGDLELPRKSPMIYMNSLSFDREVPLSEFSPDLLSLYVGCYQDSKARRLLPSMAPSISPVTPLRCAYACSLHGFAYGGLQWGLECWCGNTKLTESTLRLPDERCNSKCVDDWDAKMVEVTQDYKQSFGCGGDLALSIYKIPQQALVNKNKGGRLNSPLEDVEIVQGAPGFSCSATCRAFDPRSSCEEGLLWLIQRDCDRLKMLFGCTECVEAKDPWQAFSAPAFDNVSRRCLLSRTRSLNCPEPPAEGILRACACTKPEKICKPENKECRQIKIG